MAVCNFPSVILGRRGGSVPAVGSQQPVPWPQGSLCGGLGCIPSVTALLKCRVPRISFLSVTQEEEENRGLHSGLGPSRHKTIALPFLLPEWTLHVPGFLVGSWEACLPCACGLVLQRQRPLHCVAFLICSFLGLLSQWKHACFNFSKCVRQKGLSGLSVTCEDSESTWGRGSSLSLLGRGGPSPPPHLSFLLARPWGG